MTDKEREKNIGTTIKIMASTAFSRKKHKKQKHARKQVL